MTEVVTFEIESSIKRKIEDICRTLGISVAEAFNQLAKNFANDPFYSKNNLEYLKEITSEIDSGKAKLEKHELIEV